MDDSRHRASGQSAPIEQGTPIGPTDLPDGWRYADTEEWTDPYRAERRRKRAIVVAIVAAIVVLVAAGMTGLAVWNAVSHYGRGVHALRIHEYSWAADEFSAASIFGISYRNAQSLERQARSDEATEDARRRQAEAAQAAMIAQLDTAGASLKTGGATAVLVALQEISPAQLQAAFVGGAKVRRSVDALAGHIVAGAHAALRSGAWSRAERFTAALLLLQPSNKLAASLQAQAKSGRQLSAKLGLAKDAARHRKWHQALRLALAVAGAQRDFPGVATLIAQARTALAPKPKPAASATTTPAANPPVSAPPSQPAPP